MLVVDLAPGAFCDASLAAMSEGADHFPSYKVLKEALTTWYAHHGNQQSRERLGGPEPWLVDKILGECADRPGPMLRDWLEARGVDVEAAISARTAAQARADWSDAARVRESVRKLAGHPTEEPLGRMLGVAVARHAPENLGHIPPEYHPNGGAR